MQKQKNSNHIFSDYKSLRIRSRFSQKMHPEGEQKTHISRTGL